VDPSTGLGTVIGVIGGYEEGGNISSVSYAVYWARTSRGSTRPRPAGLNRAPGEWLPRIKGLRPQ
jgi:hypothetical protein